MRSATAFVITALVMACSAETSSTTQETSPTEPAGAGLGAACACNGRTRCDAPECGPGLTCLAQDCSANARFTGVCTRECTSPTECPPGFACWISLACGTPSPHMCLPKKR